MRRLALLLALALIPIGSAGAQQCAEPQGRFEYFREYTGEPIAYGGSARIGAGVAYRLDACFPQGGALSVRTDWRVWPSNTWLFYADSGTWWEGFSPAQNVNVPAGRWFTVRHLLRQDTRCGHNDLAYTLRAGSQIAVAHWHWHGDDSNVKAQGRPDHCDYHRQTFGYEL